MQWCQSIHASYSVKALLLLKKSAPLQVETLFFKTIEEVSAGLKTTYMCSNFTLMSLKCNHQCKVTHRN